MLLHVLIRIRAIIAFLCNSGIIDCMEIQILYSVGAILVVSLISLVGVFFLSLSRTLLDKIIFALVSLSVGVLFGDVFIHILPELFENPGVNIEAIPMAIFAGMLTFFILEKFFRWHHAHSITDDVCVDCDDDMPLDQHQKESRTHIGNMVVVGDGLHNLIDGIVITASFLTSVPLGIATTAAVLFHEIPQEISDFGVLLHAGYSRARAIVLNFSSALVAFLGVLIVVLFREVDGFLILANAFTAGGFLYIAGSDLVPELHQTTHIGKSFIQLIAIIIGFLLMFALVIFE